MIVVSHVILETNICDILFNTTDWENFDVKLILQLKPTAKISHTKKKTYTVMINE